jgi:hypothetical protein
MDLQPDQMTLGVSDGVAFAAFDLLVFVKAAWTATFRVLTDWLSMTPAVGLASLPAFSRAAISVPE